MVAVKIILTNINVRMVHFISHSSYFFVPYLADEGMFFKNIHCVAKCLYFTRGTCVTLKSHGGRLWKL